MHFYLFASLSLNFITIEFSEVLSLDNKQDQFPSRYVISQ